MVSIFIFSIISPSELLQALTQSLWLDGPAIDFQVARYLFDNH